MEHEVPIPGWGVDLPIEARPGYPLEQERHVGHDTSSGGWPPYTETIPLHGLSGVLKRLAYQYPDWKPRRWALLMLSDRVDKVESQLTPRNLAIVGGVAGLCAGLSAWAATRRKQTASKRALTWLRSLRH
ncbi:MAG TPA: hypothetical protein VIA18_02380 [Polyangia bacterium]|jgi:hypothetical protein|nr:hypothetical protein [Polyangia bacterium]